MKHIFRIEALEFAISGLTDMKQRLYYQAKSKVEQAYAPYSQFGVAAALLLNDGSIITGTNQENASYPVGICAERVALSALSVTHPGQKVRCMLIITQNLVSPLRKEGFDFKISKDIPVAPCGMCRQAISEQVTRQQEDFELLLVSGSGRVWSFEKAMSLLPLAFGTI